MNRIISISLLFLCSFLQAQWSQISTIPTTQLNAVKFFDAYTGITAGIGGVWRSTNSGVNWTQVLSGPNLNAISFLNNSTGLAVGDSGKIYRTTDSGITWNLQNSGTSNNLYSIYFPNIYHVYAVGQNGIYMMSGNGGTNWTISFIYNQDLYSVYAFPNPGGIITDVFVTGSSNSEFLNSTINNGVNWLPLIQQSGPSLNSFVPITNEYNFIIVGNSGRIRRTTNGGLGWTYPPANSTTNLYSVIFTSGNNGWLCGGNGIIEKSINAGVNWAIVSTPINNDLHSICFIDSTTGWVVGAGGVVLRTGIPVAVSQEGMQVPKDYKLFQNYPNPFNPTTTMRFSIPNLEGGKETEPISLKVYDSKGSEICVLVDRELKPGNYEIEFDGSNFSSGIYFYVMFVNKKIYDEKKLVLVK